MHRKWPRLKPSRKQMVAPVAILIFPSPKQKITWRFGQVTVDDNPNRYRLGLNWWSRRESNPRPQALYRQFYILSPVFLSFKLDHARRTGWISPSRLGFSTHPSDPDEHDFM